MGIFISLGAKFSPRNGFAETPHPPPPPRKFGVLSGFSLGGEESRAEAVRGPRSAAAPVDLGAEQGAARGRGRTRGAAMARVRGRAALLGALALALALALGAVADAQVGADPCLANKRKACMRLDTCEWAGKKSGGCRTPTNVCSGIQKKKLAGVKKRKRCSDNPACRCSKKRKCGQCVANVGVGAPNPVGDLNVCRTPGGSKIRGCFLDRAALRDALEDCQLGTACGYPIGERRCAPMPSNCVHPHPLKIGWPQMDGLGVPIVDWDVSRVTDMSGVFEGLGISNADLSKWDTSAVTSMERMFKSSTVPVQGYSLSSWDTAAVTRMDSMFKDTDVEEDLSRWNTAAVTRMDSMFEKAPKFNGDISNWNTAAVTRMDCMFEYAHKFNGDISRWNTAAVTTMECMFKEDFAFNGDISRWNTAAVTRMDSMFKSEGRKGGYNVFNGDLSRWNTAAVTRMDRMFEYAYKFNGDISSWNTTAVTRMDFMFYMSPGGHGDPKFNQDISRWNTAAVTNMTGMFAELTAFNQDLSTWNVMAVTKMKPCFIGAPWTRRRRTSLARPPVSEPAELPGGNVTSTSQPPRHARPRAEPMHRPEEGRRPFSSLGGETPRRPPRSPPTILLLSSLFIVHVKFVSALSAPEGSVAGGPSRTPGGGRARRRRKRRASAPLPARGEPSKTKKHSSKKK